MAIPGIVFGGLFIPGIKLIPMRYLITGGAGFIGSNLADHLAEDHEISIIDNFATGRSANMADLRKHKMSPSLKGTSLMLG